MPKVVEPKERLQLTLKKSLVEKLDLYALLGVAGLMLSGAAPTVTRAVQVGVVPFLWFDLLKAALALGVADRVRVALAPGRSC